MSKRYAENDDERSSAVQDFAPVVLDVVFVQSNSMYMVKYEAIHFDLLYSRIQIVNS